MQRLAVELGVRRDARHHPRLAPATLPPPPHTPPSGLASIRVSRLSESILVTPPSGLAAAGDGAPAARRPAPTLYALHGDGTRSRSVRIRERALSDVPARAREGFRGRSVGIRRAQPPRASIRVSRLSESILVSPQRPTRKATRVTDSDHPPPSAPPRPASPPAARRRLSPLHPPRGARRAAF